MTTAFQAPTANGYAPLPLGLIRISPNNPRKRFDAAKLKELVESVRQDGVLEPILVRPVAAAKDGTRFEVVAGERRFRAAGEAQLTEIPTIVRELSDAKALELALIENVLRADLNPMEEAHGLERLIKEHGYSVDDLAAKTGRSKGSIYARLKLTQLPAAAKKALLDDTINASVGLIIARIPDAKLQAKATQEILAGYSGGEPMSFRQAARHVHDHYMLSLASAPFPPADETLLPAAGSCAACPKRTGNNPDLFGDVGRADVCTDPGCFAAKKEAVWHRVQLDASKSGQPVLPEAEARKLFSHGRLHYGASYVDFDGQCNDDPKGRPWQKLLGKHAPKVVLARDDEGRVHKLVRSAEAAAALKAAGHRFATESEAQRRLTDTAKKEDAARRRRMEILRRGTDLALAAVVAKVEAQEPAAAFWKILLDGVAAGSWHDVIGTVIKRRGWNEKKVRPEELLLKRAEGMTGAQLRGLALEVVVTRGAYSTWGTPAFGKGLTAACRLYGVDLKKVESRVKADLTAKAKPKGKT